MRPYYIEVLEQSGKDDHKKLVLTVYLFHQAVDDFILDSAIQESIKDSDIFNEVLVIGFKEFIEPVKESFLSGIIAYRLKTKAAQINAYAPYEKTVFFLTFDESAGCYLVQGSGLIEGEQCQEICNFLRRATLLSLFKTTDGLKEAKSGYHYAKPSKHHAEKFLRASNVVEHYAATPIIVFWLLGKVWDVEGVEHIIVDTSGISSVGFALAHELFQRKKSKKPIYPIVSSHESYGGLDKLNITNPNQTILLISASTSGGLRNKLVNEKRAIAASVVTLFFLGESVQNAGNVLCDLEEDKNGFGLKPFRQYRKTECPLCQKNSYPITLDGDQFLPEPPEIETILLKFEDLESVERERLDQLAGIDLFCVHRKIDEEVSEIAFNVEKLFEAPKTDIHKPTVHALEEFKKRWDRELVRASTLNLKHVVYAAYPYSQELAAKSHAHLVSKGCQGDKAVDSGGLLKVASSNDSSALVITACLDNPKELNSVCLTLRDRQPQGNIFYLTPIFKADSSEGRKRVRSNLTYGENKADTFSLISVINFNLPTNPKQDSWSAELVFLNKFKEWLDRNELDIPHFLEDRTGKLENAPHMGLVEGLFWPGMDGDELTIRSDFTFIKTYAGERRLSQADIFVVVSSLLRALRSRVGSADKPALVYGPYKRSVISPDCFERFSDGVIQAAILRAARGQELSYANCTETVSARMRDVITNLLNGPENSAQAVPEFLLAIALKKLNLHSEHEKKIFNAVSEHERVNNEAKLLVQYLQQQLERRLA
ncbi:MAG: hypothetical protein ABL877_11865 [Thiobacillus sp.]